MTGPTGDYPNGKISEDDEGGLQMAIGIANDGEGVGEIVLIDFGSPVTWVGLRANDAIEIGNKLTERGMRLAGNHGGH